MATTCVRLSKTQAVTGRDPVSRRAALRGGVEHQEHSTGLPHLALQAYTSAKPAALLPGLVEEMGFIKSLNRA